MPSNFPEKILGSHLPHTTYMVFRNHCLTQVISK